jgi:FtsH-binding integral membrane protein
VRVPDAIWFLKLAAIGLIVFGTPAVAAVSFHKRTRAWKRAAGFMVVAYLVAVTTMVVVGREPDSGPNAAAAIMWMLFASALTALLSAMISVVVYIRSLR